MSLTSTMLLGFIAGVTILLGLPLGRLRSPAPTLRALLNATTIGVLLFLVWDAFRQMTRGPIAGWSWWELPAAEGGQVVEPAEDLVDAAEKVVNHCEPRRCPARIKGRPVLRGKTTNWRSR